ncbi:MAG: isopentenyl phosphate kinase [Thermoplasmata archaeon]
MILLKIGGSVITDKRVYRKLKDKVLTRIVGELINTELIIVHGGGSFGHIVSDSYQLQYGLKSDKDRIQFSTVGKDMQDLNSIILGKLIERGIPAVSVPVHSFHMVGEQFKVDRFRDLIERNFIPVTYGDIVLDPKRSMIICSGDQIMFHLAKAFRPEKVVFVTDVDGIFDKNPKKYIDARFISEITGNEDIQFGKDVSDVTGSMEGKFKVMKNISNMGIDVMMVNGLVPGRVKKALLGEKVKCTRWSK